MNARPVGTLIRQKSRGGMTTKIHLLAADDRTAVTCTLSPGQDHDSPHGRAPLEEVAPQPAGRILVTNQGWRRWANPARASSVVGNNGARERPARSPAISAAALTPGIP